MTSLNELKRRVEAATGADREIDVLLWAELVEGRDVIYADDGYVLGRSRRPPHDVCRIGFVDPGKHSSNFYTAGEPSASAPYYTSSIDAALSLMERCLPGWSYTLDTRVVSRRSDDGAVRCALSENWSIGGSKIGYATTMPLAIISALLSALSAAEAER